MNINEIFSLNNDTPLFCGSKNARVADFVADVGRYANYFNGIAADTVILYIPNDFYLFCVCFFALLQNHKSVALPGLLTPQNAKDYADLTNVIVTDLETDFAGFTKISPVAPNGKTDWRFIDVSEECIYFFTSGSTGTPKRIKKTMNMLLAEVEYHVNHHMDQIAQSPVIVASIAPYHMYGILWRVLFPMMGGMAVDTDMIFAPEELIKKQSQYDKVLFLTTPSFLDGISRYSEQYEFAKNCIGIFTSGSLLRGDTSEFAYKTFGTSPFEVFGSTETGGIAYRQQANNSDWAAFDTVNLGVQDGCLVVRSPYAYQNPYLMSDAVDMIDDRHFKLLGRADRIVKISEERVSLPDMEGWLGEHKYVSRAYCCMMRSGTRDSVACMLELTDAGAERIMRIGRRAFIDEVKKYLAGFVPAVALPRRIRIVNQIPTNAQGKFVKDEIIAALNSSVAEPVVQNVTKTDMAVTADLTFLGDSAYFVGHFPGFPILPGVIQMHFVFHFIRQFFHVTAPAFDVIKLKYTSLILPDVTTHFELVRIGTNEFSFCYSQHGKACSVGRIVIKGGVNV